MPQNEDVLWDTLKLMRGHTTGWTFGTEADKRHNTVENGYAVGQLRAALLLKYLPQDIEDTIYFMKYRGYLEVHGQGMVMPEIAYGLTRKGIEVHDSQNLPEDERTAFAQALWKIEPKLYGVGPNLPAWEKRLQKWKRRFQRK